MKPTAISCDELMMTNRQFWSKRPRSRSAVRRRVVTASALLVKAFEHCIDLSLRRARLIPKRSTSQLASC
jgi:hypothetical protein